MAQHVSIQPEPAAATTPALEVHLGTHSDPGKVRTNNEDRLTVVDLRLGQPVAKDGSAEMSLDSPGILLLVADGMGGMLAGEKASQMCIENVPALLLKRLREQPGADRATRQKFLSEAVAETHELILQAATSDPKCKGMGTTATAALIEEGTLCIAQVGDSRLYRGRRSQVTQLTRDQTVWETMSKGTEDPQAAFSNAPWKNMLVQALGAQPDINVVLSEHDLAWDDWYLICSDGLYRVVTAEDLGEAFWSPGTPAEKARRLIALANERGGPDNVSSIVFHLALP